MMPTYWTTERKEIIRIACNKFDNWKDRMQYIRAHGVLSSQDVISCYASKAGYLKDNPVGHGGARDHSHREKQLFKLR